MRARFTGGDLAGQEVEIIDYDASTTTITYVAPPRRRWWRRWLGPVAFVVIVAAYVGVSFAVLAVVDAI